MHATGGCLQRPGGSVTTCGHAAPASTVLPVQAVAVAGNLQWLGPTHDGSTLVTKVKLKKGRPGTS